MPSSQARRAIAARRRNPGRRPRRPIDAWSPPDSASGSITTGGRRAGTPATPRRTTSPPSGFETSLRAAIEQSDEYVWIYTEKPRWWSEKGGAIDLPLSYIETVRRVRRALVGE